ncbi:unnamed protein product, partial [Closterium sp. NIES-54]
MACLCTHAAAAAAAATAAAITAGAVAVSAVAAVAAGAGVACGSVRRSRRSVRRWLQVLCPSHLPLSRSSPSLFPRMPCHAILNLLQHPSSLAMRSPSPTAPSLCLPLQPRAINRPSPLSIAPLHSQLPLSTPLPLSTLNCPSPLSIAPLHSQLPLSTPLPLSTLSPPFPLHRPSLLNQSPLSTLHRPSAFCCRQRAFFVALLAFDTLANHSLTTNTTSVSSSSSSVSSRGGNSSTSGSSSGSGVVVGAVERRWRVFRRTARVTEAPAWDDAVEGWTDLRLAAQVTYRPASSSHQPPLGSAVPRSPTRRRNPCVRATFEVVFET